MPRRNFDNELEALRAEFVQMGTLIEEAIEKSIRAFADADVELAQEVCDNDRYINASEKDIQSHALTLMLRQQPVAGDLRAVSAALRAATDMERIGDQAADVAALVLQIAKRGDAAISRRISEMAAATTGMVKNSVNAFSAADTALARRVIDEDDRVDDMFDDIKTDIVSALRRGVDEEVDLCIDMLMIAKYFEKIGDHAVNIARWTIFTSSGKLDDVRLI